MTTFASLTRGSATAVTSQATASITTTANQLALLFVVSRETFNFAVCATPTCTGWTQVATLEYDVDGGGRERVTLLRRLSGSSSTGTHTISFGATSQAVLRWSITETDTDVDTGGTNGSAAIVQSVTNSGGTVTALTVTLAAFGSTSNATWGGFGFGGDGASGTIALTVGSGFTSLDNISGTGILDAALLVEYKTTNDTTVDATDSITAVWCGGIAVEVKAAAAGGASGTLARTNANDTSAASGTTTVVGSLARTNANDTSSASGTTTVTGSLASTNAADTSAAAGSTTVTGSLARTNANDTLAASGTAGAVTGTLAYTNANDTLSASGVAGDPSPPPFYRLYKPRHIDPKADLQRAAEKAFKRKPAPEIKPIAIPFEVVLPEIEDEVPVNDQFDADLARVSVAIDAQLKQAAKKIAQASYDEDEEILSYL